MNPFDPALTPSVNPAPTATPEDPSQVGVGFDQNVASLRQAANNFIGQQAAAAGFNNFAGQRFAAADEAAADAARAGQGRKVQSWRDIGSLRDAGNFLAAEAGGMIPALVGGVAGGAIGGAVGGVPGALAGATLPFIPAEAGDIAGRQRARGEDMTSLRGARDAFLGGAASAAGQNILPAMVGGKLVGAGLRAAAPTLAKSVATNLAENVAGNALAGGAAEVGKQAVSGQELDMNAAIDAAVTGGVMGVPLAGVGVVGDRLHAPRAPRRTEALDQAQKTAPGAAEQAGGVPEADIREAVPPGGALGGEDPPIVQVQRQANENLSSLSGSLNERAAAARQHLEEIRGNPDIPADVREMAETLGENLGNRNAQAFVKAAAERFRKAADEDTRTDTVAAAERALDDTGDRLSDGTPLGDLKAFEGKTGDALNEVFTKSQELAEREVRTRVERLRNRPDLSPTIKDIVDRVAGDPRLPTAGREITQAERWQELKDTGKRTIKTLGDAFKTLAKDLPESLQRGQKKSADAGPIRQAIAETILPGLRERNPELVADADSVNALADTLQTFVQLASKGANVEPHIRTMVSLLGPDAETSLRALAVRVLGSEADNTTFSRVMDRAQELGARDSTVRDTMESLLPENTRLTGERMASFQDAAMAWARGEGRGGDDAKGRFNDRRMRELIQQVYEGNADQVFDALEAYAGDERRVPGKARRAEERNGTEVDTEEVDRGNATAGEPVQRDASQQAGADFGELSEGSTNAVYHGAGNNPLALESMYENPRLARGRFPDRESAAEQAIKKLEAKNPGKVVRWISEAEYLRREGMQRNDGSAGDNNRGFLVVEEAVDPDRITPRQLETMKLDTKTRSRSASRLDLEDGTAIDAVKLTSRFRQNLESGDQRGDVARSGLAFMDGVAALTEYGALKGEIPDTLVIDKAGTTFGEVKQAMRVAYDVESNLNANEKAKLEAAREQYKEAREAGDTNAMEEIQDRVASLYEDSKARTLTDKEATPEQQAMAKMLLDDMGRQELPLDAPPQEGAALGQPLRRDLNMDSTTNDLRGEPANAKAAIAQARKLTKTNQGLGERLMRLAMSADSMSEADVRALNAIKAGDADAKEQINALARKYADVIAAPGREAIRQEGFSTADPLDRNIQPDPNWRQGSYGGNLSAAEAAAEKAWLDSPAGKSGLKSTTKLRESVAEAADNEFLAISYEIMNGLLTSGAPAEQIRATARALADDMASRAKAIGTREALDRARASWHGMAGMVEQLAGPTNPAADAAVSTRLKAGETSLRDAMTDLIAHGDETQKVIARAVRQVAGDQVRVSLGERMAAEHLGVFHPTTGQININPAIADRASNTLLHEGVHAATVRGLSENKELHNAAYALLQHVLKSDEGMAARYASTNTLEFIAEGLSSSVIQERLRKIPASTEVQGLLGGVKNMWEAFTTLVRRALGVSEKDASALTQFLDISGAALRGTAEAGSVRGGMGEIANARLPAVTKEFGATFKDVMDRAPGGVQQGLIRWRNAFEGGPTYRDLLALEVVENALNKGGDLSGMTPDGAYNMLRNQALDFFQELPSKVEGSPDPKGVAAKKAALLKAASSGDARLNEELASASDAGALQRAAAELVRGAPDSEALRVANERLGTLVESDPQVPYDLLKKSASAAPQGPNTVDPAVRADIRKYVEERLGNTVRVAFKRLGYEGDFTPDVKFKDGTTGDLIRIALTSLNPWSTAHHESAHAFVKQLRDAGMHDIVNVLQKAADSSYVRKQVERTFAGNKDVMAQLRGADPEERVAYMYQLWAQGLIEVAPSARGTFRKIADYVRGVLGMVANDERALAIMEHFNSGAYGKNLGGTDPVLTAMRAKSQSGFVRAAQEVAGSLKGLSDTVFATGEARVRDTDNPTLNRIADLIKPDTGDTKGGDVGYIAASRLERSNRVNDLGRRLAGVSEQHVREALEALQSGKAAPSPEARLAAREVKAVLRETYDYMTAAGVEINDLGKDYFPRIWDATRISQNQPAFQAMLQKYVQSGQFQGDPLKLMQQLIAREGNEFDVDVRTPGMQHAKERVLKFITPEDAAPFLEKDLYRTLSGYISQATRRAEWTRRFGKNSEGLDEMLLEAGRTGATKEQIETTEKYLKGVTGTLGDSMNPTLRRLSGNMIVYQNIRLLPLAIFSSIVDPVGIAVRGGTVGDAWSAFKRGVREIPGSYRKEGAPKDAATEMAETLGVIDNALLAHTLGDTYNQGMVGSTAQKINDTFFRWNLMEQYNRSMRVGATQAALRFIDKHAQGENPQHSARWLDELGLTAADVQRNQDGSLKLTEADGLTPEQALKMRTAVNTWVDGAILRPDAASKPIWMNDPRWALVAHLKSFVYAFHHTIVDRVVHEAKEGNYQPAMALAAYVPVAIAADAVKGMLINGGEEPDWKKGWGAADYLWNGVQRAGLLGVGQFRYDIGNDVDRGGSGFGAMVGPTIQQLTQGVRVLHGKAQFEPFALNSMPANDLYERALR